MSRHYPQSLTGHIETLYKRISRLTRIAATNGTVMENLASRAYPTNSRARVNAFLIHTSSVASTFCANNTLGPTSWWCAFEIGKARTSGLVIHIGALTVWSTGWRFAGIRQTCHSYCYWYITISLSNYTLHKWRIFLKICSWKNSRGCLSMLQAVNGSPV